jgi:hypothetical protein
MADAKKTGAASVFLAKHGEKLGLGIAALALLAYLLLGVVMAKDDPSIRDLDGEKRRIESERTKIHKEFTGAAVNIDSAASAVPWNTVSTAKPGVDTVALLTPEVKFKEIEPHKDPIKVALCPTVAFGSAAVDFDGVTLTWTIKDFTKAEKRKGEKENDYLGLDHFLIERAPGGTDKWEKLTEVDGTTTSYKDTNIDPKKKYSYRITSFPETDTNAKREVKAKGQTIAPPGAIQTQGIWKLSFLNPSKPSGSVKGMVMIKIEKYEKGKGTVNTSHIHYAGDKIGAWEEQPGSGDFVTTHRTFMNGKALAVDFGTGFSLIAVEPAKVTLEVKKCKKKYDKGGNWVDCEIVTEKRSFETHEITFTDEEGEKKILSPNPRDSRLGQDDLCENHGGGKIQVSRPGGGSDVKPPEVKEDPKVAAKRKQEEEAARIFADAEKAEAAKNKSAALDLFHRLQKDYAATDFVSKQMKNVIEEKVARLSK